MTEVVSQRKASGVWPLMQLTSVTAAVDWLMYYGITAELGGMRPS